MPIPIEFPNVRMWIPSGSSVFVESIAAIPRTERLVSCREGFLAFENKSNFSLFIIQGKYLFLQYCRNVLDQTAGKSSIVAAIGTFWIVSVGSHCVTGLGEGSGTTVTGKSIGAHYPYLG